MKNWYGQEREEAGQRLFILPHRFIGVTTAKLKAAAAHGFLLGKHHIPWEEEESGKEMSGLWLIADQEIKSDGEMQF